MDENLVQEILDALFSSLEGLETRTMAILQFMKDKGLATEEGLAPHLEQAANASNVRWRGFPAMPGVNCWGYDNDGGENFGGDSSGFEHEGFRAVLRGCFGHGDCLRRGRCVFLFASR